MSSPDPYLHALYLAHGHMMRETRSTAKRVPADARERRGYRKGLRQAAAILVEMISFYEDQRAEAPHAR